MMSARTLSLFIVAVLILSSSPASPCQYEMKIFNHRLDGTKLRLYVDMTSKSGADASQVQLDHFDTRHSAGKGILKDIGLYHQKGNGLSTVLLLDRSGSLNWQLQAKTREASIQYVDAMEKGDEVALIFFAQEKDQVGFSSEPGEIRGTINSKIVGARPRPMKPDKQTRLYNYMVDAIHLAAEQGGRELKLVLVMSDGQEEVFGYTPEQVIEEAKKTHVGIFAVGFRGKSNLKGLEQLKQIAEQTGGRYVEADASSDLSGIFLYARKRAKKFLVVDEELCGLSKAEVSARPELDVQLLYDDCTSEHYAMPMNLLEEDLPACPNCSKGGDADCQDHETCVQGFCQKVETTASCQKIAAHKVQAVSCSANADCESLGKCICVQGQCAEGQVECQPWQKYDDQKGECAAIACGEGVTCPENTECREGKCAAIALCQPCQEKKDGVCFYVEDCKTDCRCAAGCACQDGQCLPSDLPEAQERPKCQDCNAPINGKCQVVECKDDADCESSCVSAQCVCAPEFGIEAEEGAKLTCQPLAEGPCNEAEIEVSRDSKTLCRVVACSKDTQCKDGDVCDGETGECMTAPFPPPWAWAAIGGGVLLLVILIVVLKRRKKEEDEEPEPAKPNPVKVATKIEEPPSPGPQNFQPGPNVHQRTMQDRPGPSGPVGPAKAHTVAESPYRLSISWEGRTVDRVLSFGTMTLGRESGEIQVPAGVVSNPHLRLQVTPSGVTVTDLGSTNGTFVNGNRLHVNEPLAMRPGTELMLGSVVRLRLGAAGPGVPGPGPGPVKGATVIDR